MLRRIVELVYPPECVFCGVGIEGNEKRVCAPCIKDLPWITRGCVRCGLPLNTMLSAEMLCVDCQNDPPPYERTIAPLRYEFPVDAAVKALKFRKQLHYGPALAEILLSTVGRVPPDVDALLPVPLHFWRFVRRGFNQAYELAAPVADELGLPVIDNVKRISATPYQSGLGAKERRRNLRDAFRIRGHVPYEHVLIIDDVITTGETCRQLAAAIKQKGVQKVSVLAVARTMAPESDAFNRNLL